MSTHRLSGFTLVETLVAVTILVLAVAGPLTVAGRVLIAAQNSKDQLTASYLAQEGVEYVRAMRDAEFLAAHQAGGSTASDDAWKAFASGGASGSGGSIEGCRDQTCTLDTFSQMGTGSGFALTPCTSSCAPLYLVAGTGQYRSNVPGSTQTKYTRTIQATLLSSATDMQIVSKVTWVSRGTTYSVTVSDNLTPWQ